MSQLPVAHMRSAVAVPPSINPNPGAPASDQPPTYNQSYVAQMRSAMGRPQPGAASQDAPNLASANASASGCPPDGQMAMTHMRSAVAMPPAGASDNRSAEASAMTHMRSAVAMPPSGVDNDRGAGASVKKDQADSQIAMTHMRSAVAMPPASDANASGAPAGKRSPDAPMGMTHMRSALPAPQAHAGAADEESAASGPPAPPADGDDVEDGKPTAMTHMRSALAMPPSMHGPNSHQMAHHNDSEAPEEDGGVGRRGSGIKLGPDEVVYADDQQGKESRIPVTQMRSAIAMPPDAANASQEARDAPSRAPAQAPAAPGDAGSAQMSARAPAAPSKGDEDPQSYNTTSELVGTSGLAMNWLQVNPVNPDLQPVNPDLQLDSVSALRLGVAKNWHLSSSELWAVLRSAGIQPSAILNIADIRQKMSESRGLNLPSSELRDALLTGLRSVDTTRDGHFTLEDLRQALSLSIESTTRRHVACLHGHDPSAGHWVSRDGLVNFLENRRAQFQNCLALPCSLIFFVLFFFVMIWHAEMETAGALSLAVEDAVSRPDKWEIGFPDSAWTWLASYAETNMIVPHTPTIGGVRFIILGRGEETVADHKSKSLCEYSRHEFHVDSLGGGVPDKPKICGSPGLSVVWLHWPLQRDEAESALLKARKAWEAQWEQGNVTIVPHGTALQFLAQNNKKDFYALYTYTVHFDESGLPLSKTSVSTFSSKPVWLDSSEISEEGEHRTIMILDMCFCGMIVLQAVLEFYNMFFSGGCRCFNPWVILCQCCKCCRGRNPGRCSCGYFNIWSFCRWLNIIMALLLVLLYDFCEYSTHGLNQLVSELPIIDQAKRYSNSSFTDMMLNRDFTLDNYELHLDAILEQGQKVADVWDEMYWYVAVMALCTCLRLIEACRANPRLNITISTLRRAAADVFHLVVLLLAFLAPLFLIGHMIYGSRIEAFSTGYQAFESTVLFLAGYTYNSIHSKLVEVGGTLGIVWVFILNIIVVLVLVHVAMSMVLYIYLEARHEKTDNRTLRQQMASFFGSEEATAGNLSRFSFASVRRALRNGAHPEALMSSASLSTALGANDRDSQNVLDHMLKKAKADQREMEAPVSAADIERMYCRVDTNVRALDQVVRGIGCSLESANLRDGMIEIPVPGALRNPVADDVEIEDLTSEQPTASKREAALPDATANVEDAPFEGVTFGETWDLDELLEDRVTELEKADAENCARLEKQIGHLGDMISKLQANRHAGVAQRRNRLYQLENMLEDVAERFRPLFERLP
mmetsp:Transcript_87949/g.151939  ORF Transcript_87949/g.151939 Transcript_87949/m.151939 type:complete len:1267 (-) Transcript_87949:61-3861(-)